MRVLLTRPEADAKRSAARLEALGHEAIVAPLFEIVPTRAPLPAGRFDALLATSAHAFDALPPEAENLKQRPLHVVGERTAAAARNCGFTKLETISPDAKSLAIALARTPPTKSFLYLAGRERRPELEASLVALGHGVAPWALYEAREAESAPGRLARIWRSERLDAVLHFSPRSAALYVALADSADLRAAATAPVQVAISQRAAEPLAGAPDLRIAPTPDLAGMISCL